MNFDRKNYSNELLTHLYQSLLRPRLIEEKMLVMLRQNKISKWFSGIGQEAISTGIAAALEDDEFIFPMHRNLGVFTQRQVSLKKLWMQWCGGKEGFTKGRDRSFHFGTLEHHIVGMISHIGAQNGVAAGVALASQLKGEKKITVVFNGEGGTSEGDFHEAVNLAAVWDLPVLFVIENNGYSLSTPVREQYRCDKLIDKAIGYGIKGFQVDGNNVLEVYDTVKRIGEKMRETPSPVLLECTTFRMRGHEEASGMDYVKEVLIEEWAKKDPIENFENFLLSNKIISQKEISKWRNDIQKEIEECVACEIEWPEPTSEMEDVYFPYMQKVVRPDASVSEKRMVDAIREGLQQSMERFSNLVLMGQDIAEYGGVFKATDGLAATFGKERVRNTPLCESAVIGAGLGLSVKEMKSVIEIQFADFVTEGFTQIINNLAKSHYRWEQCADVVLRMPTGAGGGAGPFHSQSNEAWFFHTPGLKIVYPSTPYDAKGLLNAAIEDKNPYLFFEHKMLYRSLKEFIPDNYYTVEIGKAKWVAEGENMSIITYGMGVHWAKEILKANPSLCADLLDLRTLLPWDKEAVRATVEKTGRVLVLHEATLTGGIGAEIAAWIGEHCFSFLDAPVMRVASLDTPVPFSKSLERNFLPQQRLYEKLVELSKF